MTPTTSSSASSPNGETDMNDIDIECSNPRHPLGPWHPSTPIPPSWEHIERVRQWWRRRKYGCGCSA